MRFAAKVCAVVGLLAGATAALAEPVALQFKYTKGEVDKYRMTLGVSLDLSELPAGAVKTAPPVTDVTMTIAMVQKTLAVYPDGSAKVRITFSQPSFEGIKLPPDASKAAGSILGQGIVVTLSKRGLPLSVQSLGKLTQSAKMPKVDLSSAFNASSSFAFLPPGPVELGQSWGANIPLPFANSQLNVQSTFAGADEEIWNIPVARIKQTCSGQMDLKEMVQSLLTAAAGSLKGAAPDLSSMSGYLSLNGEMTHYFAPAMGKVLKSDGSLQAKISVTMPPDLIKQGAPPKFAVGVNLRMAMTRFN